MSLHYFLRSGRVITGPFSESQIRQKFRTGQVTREAEISLDKRQWEPLVRLLAPAAELPDPGWNEAASEAEPAIRMAVPPQTVPEAHAAPPPPRAVLAGAAPQESAARVIGSTLQLIWDGPEMQTFLAAAAHPHLNKLVYGTAVLFPLFLAGLSAAVLNVVLHRGAGMWLFCFCAMLTLFAVPALECLLMRLFRPADNVLAEAQIGLSCSAMLIPALLYHAACPVLMRAGLAWVTVVWGAAVLAVGLFFAVQMTAGLIRLLTREHRFSVRAAAVFAAGILWQTGMLAAGAVWFFNSQKGM